MLEGSARAASAARDGGRTLVTPKPLRAKATNHRKDHHHEKAELTSVAITMPAPSAATRGPEDSSMGVHLTVGCVRVPDHRRHHGDLR